MCLSKIESLSKSFAAVVIPIILLVVGQDFAAATKQREIEAKFVELATSILTNNPGTKPAAEVQSLRRWAVEIIDKYSGVPMPKDTANALIQSTPLPSMRLSSEQTNIGPWAVVFGGDKTLKSAQFEVDVTAKKMSIVNAIIYFRNGFYRSIALFNDRSSAEEALGKARVVQPVSYLVDISKWCPTTIDRTGYQECLAP